MKFLRIILLLKRASLRQIKEPGEWKNYPVYAYEHAHIYTKIRYAYEHAHIKSGMA
jgi:hypothetical protein